MTERCIDASIMVKVVVAEEFSDIAAALVKDTEAEGVAIVAPFLLAAEVASTLSKKFNFNESLLREKIAVWQNGLKHTHELYDRNPTSLIAELKRDGVIITVGEHRDAPLLFLHLTFQEYLAACDLFQRAKPTDKEDWQAIAAIVDKKAWLPSWQEVLVLLAGKLTDPIPLLTMLSAQAPTATNPHGDDVFRHRLALAALCLSEISPTLNANTQHPALSSL